MELDAIFVRQRKTIEAPPACHEIVNGHLRFKSQGQTEENNRVRINHEQNELVTSIWERKRP